MYDTRHRKYTLFRPPCELPVTFEALKKSKLYVSTPFYGPHPDVPSHNIEPQYRHLWTVFALEINPLDGPHCLRHLPVFSTERDGLAEAVPLYFFRPPISQLPLASERAVTAPATHQGDCKLSNLIFELPATGSWPLSYLRHPPFLAHFPYNQPTPDTHDADQKFSNLIVELPATMHAECILTFAAHSSAARVKI